MIILAVLFGSLAKVSVAKIWVMVALEIAVAGRGLCLIVVCGNRMNWLVEVLNLVYRLD